MFCAVPEISRISPFDNEDVVQIFAENADRNTKLYVWYNTDAAIKYDLFLTDTEKFPTKQHANEYKRSLAKSLPVDFEGVENIDNNLPEVPPEDAIVFTPDDVAANVLYFGERSGPQPIDGKRLRVNPDVSIMWLKNEVGFSKPHIANRPEIWNCSAHTAIAGDKITFYGRSLGKVIGFDDGTHFSKIGMVRNLETGEYTRLEGLEDSCYETSAQYHMSEYRIPADMSEGEYEFYAYAGSAGIYGWSKGYKINIKRGYNLNDYFRNKWSRPAGDRRSLPECKVISLECENSPFADSTDKIQNAIDKIAAAGEGIVYLGAGTFYISRTINVKPGVVLLGSGNSTVIKANQAVGLTEDWSDVIFCEKPTGALGWANNWLGFLKDHNENTAIRLLDNCGVDSLKIELGNGLNMGVLVANNISDRADNVFCNNVEVDGMNLSEYERDGEFGVTCSAFTVGAKTRELTVYSCNFIATIPIYILPSRHLYAKIVNNHLEARPRQINESALNGLRYSVIANNLFKSGRRTFVSQEGLSNNWIYQNRSEDVARAANALEAYMSEHGEGVWEGKAISVGDNFIEIGSRFEDVFRRPKKALFKDIREEFHYFLFILKGRGFGQYLEVVDTEETENGVKLILEKAWNVSPDGDTYFTLVFGAHHNMWLHNNTALSGGHSQFIWNCGFENIIDTHFMDLSAGMRFYSHHAEKGEEKIVSVCAFNTISGCRTRSSGTGITFNSYRTGIDYTADKWQDFNFSRGIFGNCIKNCVFDGAVGHIYCKNLGCHQNEPYEAGIVLDGGFNRVVRNRIIGFKNPYYLLGNSGGNCFARNTVTDYETLFKGDAKPIGFDIKERQDE